MLEIGQQVQRIRKLRKVSLTRLAETSGVQIATLSRMEHGKMTGTVESHLEIAKALGVKLTDLYEPIQKDAVAPVVAGERLEVISAANDKVTTEILTRLPGSKKMLPVLIRIAGKASTSSERSNPGTERFIFVLEGTIVLHVAGQAIKLKENTSLYFEATQEHFIENPLSSAAKVLSISTPVHL